MLCVAVEYLEMSLPLEAWQIAPSLGSFVALVVAVLAGPTAWVVVTWLKHRADNRRARTEEYEARTRRIALRAKERSERSADAAIPQPESSESAIPQRISAEDRREDECAWFDASQLRLFVTEADEPRSADDIEKAA